MSHLKHLALIFMLVLASGTAHATLFNFYAAGGLPMTGTLDIDTVNGVIMLDSRFNIDGRSEDICCFIQSPLSGTVIDLLYPHPSFFDAEINFTTVQATPNPNPEVGMLSGTIGDWVAYTLANDPLGQFYATGSGGQICMQPCDPTAAGAPGPIAGAGLPGVLAMLVGGFMWWQRKLTFSMMP
jgi:hypothetical protein